MRTLLNICLLVIVALGTVPPAVLALDAAAFIAAAPPLETFAGDDVVILYRAETVQVDEDGHLTRRVQTLQRLQTQWAMRNRSDVRVAWDSSRQDLEVVTARTFMRDGTVVPTPDNGFNEVTPGAVSRAAIFLNWRELVISHVGTEPGCVVELEYVLRDRLAGALPASGECWLGAEYPVIECRVTVGGAMALAVNADGVEHVEARNTWIARDLPAYRTEGPVAHRSRYVPHVAWSRLAGAQGLATALRRQQQATAQPSASLDSWLAEARTDPDVLTDADLAQRIAALVHDGTSGVTVPGGPWGATPRPAGEVYDTASGTDWERAILAYTLMEMAGWQPEIGIFGEAALDDAAPVVADRFDHLRVVARLGSDNWWIAPDRGDAWTGNADLAGWTGMFITAAGDHRVYTVPARDGVCRWSARLGADDNGGWTATGDLVLRGAYRTEGQDAHALADELAATLLPDAEVTSVEVREDSPQVLSLRLTATAADLGETEAGLLVRDVPWPTTGVLAHLPAGFHPGRPTRTAPLWITTAGAERVTIRIDLPESWTLDLPTGELSETAPLTTFTQSASLAGHTLTVTRTLTIEAGELSATDYPAFHTAVTAAQTATRSPLVLLTD